jgi:hypothetical protein
MYYDRQLHSFFLSLLRKSPGPFRSVPTIWLQFSTSIEYLNSNFLRSLCPYLLRRHFLKDTPILANLDFLITLQKCRKTPHIGRYILSRCGMVFFAHPPAGQDVIS